MNKNILLVIGWARKHTLGIILLVGLIQGLVYVFSIPPWWHFDEPGHFEFAWQIAHFDHWPKFNEIDENMRRQMAASMNQYGWYETTNYRLNLSRSDPVYVGAGPQTTNYPLYYIFASLPLRLLGNADFAVQNRAVRLVSLIMFLLTLYFTWKTLGELVPEGHPLQWMVTIFMALLPGLVDTMTSINDDAGAVLAYSIFIWASVRLVKNGMSLSRFAWLLISLALCYWTKNTTWPAIPISLLVILFSLFAKRWQWIPWSLVAVFALAGLLFVFRWGDAALWYLYTPQTHTFSTETSLAPVGKHVFQLTATNGQYSYIGQWFSPTQTRPLRNKTVTLGAWMWADQPTQAYIPILIFTTKDGDVPSAEKAVNLTTSPVFYSITISIPNEAERMRLFLQPSLAQGGMQTFYYDGVTLLVGDKEAGEPNFSDAFASHGTWAGTPFENLVRNASAESNRFWLNPVISKKLFYDLYPGSFPGSLDVFIASLQDWQGSSWYYHDEFQTLFQTFWGRAARDKAGLLAGPLSYNFLEIITLISLPGLLIFIWHKRKLLPWAVLFVMGVEMMGIWGLVLARGGGTLYFQDPVYTWARYAFPATIPVAILLCVGWWEGLCLVGRYFNISTAIQHIIFISFMFGLDIFAVISLMHYFYLDQGQEYFLLFILLPVTIFLSLFALMSRKSNVSVE